jgi:hypothetical protein
MAHDSNSLLAGVSGLALGAGLMYVLDPARGRARRKLVHDKLVHAEHELADAGRVAAHDLANRVRGLGHDLASVTRPRTADDDVLTERVRATIGHAISHPGAVEVESHEGTVVLKGPVLRSEVDELLRAARHVRGVRKVVNQLDVRDEPGRVPALQGARKRRRRLRERTSPSTRLLAAVGLGALFGAGALRLRHAASER